MAEEVRNSGQNFSETLDRITKPEGPTWSQTLNDIMAQPREAQPVAAAAGPALNDDGSYDAGEAGVSSPGIDAFNEVTKDVKLSDTYVLEDIGDHKKHYEGVLGSFDYDDREFQLRQAVDPSKGESEQGDFMFLAYIGKETKGKNIMIPQGLENTSFMFADTKLESASVIPDGVKRADCMFMDCHNLKEAKLDLPSSLESSAYMFANCEHLEKGPRTIPGTVKNADYMFGSCASLQYTPKINPGVQSMEAAFMDCKTLTEAPKIPKTVRTARDATLGCSGIDKAKDAAQAAQYEKEKAAMIKKTEHRGITQRLGSGVAAVLQCHALHQRGYGLLMSMWQVHAMRKNNQMGRNVRDGIAAVAQRHGPLGLAMAMKMKSSSQAKDQARQERKEEYIKEWTRLHDLGSEFNKGLKKMASTGSKDVKSGLFERYANMTGSERDACTSAYGMTGVFKSQEDTVRSMNTLAGGDTTLYKQVAQWYKERLADKEAYFSEAEYSIKNDKDLTKARRDRSLEGLELAKSDFMAPMLESMKTMQDQYGLFNQGDQRDIDRVLKKMGQPSLFHTDDAQAQQQRVGQQAMNYQQPALNWREVPNRSAEAAAPAADRNVKEPVVAPEPNVVKDAEPKPVNKPTAEPVKPVTEPAKPAAEPAKPAAEPVFESVTRPAGWRSQIFKDPPMFSSGEATPVAPKADKPSVAVESKPAASVAKTTTLTHEAKVRMAESVSADVQHGQPEKGKGGPELQ